MIVTIGSKKIFGKDNTCFSSFSNFGINQHSFIDKICAFLLVISPIFQHYKGFYKNAGFSVLIIAAMWLLFRLFNNRCISVKLAWTMLPLMLYQLYAMFDHGTSVSKILYNCFMIMVFFTIASECINFSYVIQYATMICLFASFLLCIQYICYYLLHFHLQLVPTELLLPESSSWVAGAKTGLINIRGGSNGFYRPSAFFLEPSHLFIYFMPVLCFLLLSSNMKPWKLKCAIIITVGIVLSTSGMGSVVAAFIWIVFIAFFYDGKNGDNKSRILKILTKRNFMYLGILCMIFIILYFSVDAVQNTLSRIFVGGSDSIAISGRIGQASGLIKQLSGRTLVFGLTDDVSYIEYNLPGFFATLYKKGIIGIGLSYWYYVRGVFKLNGACAYLSIIIVVLSFFTAHTHGTFYMLYFVMYLMSGYFDEYSKLAYQE